LKILGKIIGEQGYMRGAQERLWPVAQLLALFLHAYQTLVKDRLYINNYVHMQGGKAQVKWSGKINEPIYLIGSQSMFIVANIKFSIYDFKR
jgi:hypothetical protein